MIYAYYRVSTDHQDIASQRFGVQSYCESRSMKINEEIIDFAVSGCVNATSRNLGKLLRKIAPGDGLIVPELSRLGRRTGDVLNTCQKLLKKKVYVYFVKNNITLEDNPTSNLMITLFSAFSQLERDLISQRTKEALAKLKADGVRLGRPPGHKTSITKCDSKRDKIEYYMQRGFSRYRIAKKVHVSYTTLTRYLTLRNII